MFPSDLELYQTEVLRESYSEVRRNLNNLHELKKFLLNNDLLYKGREKIFIEIENDIESLLIKDPKEPIKELENAALKAAVQIIRYVGSDAENEYLAALEMIKEIVKETEKRVLNIDIDKDKCLNCSKKTSCCCNNCEILTKGEK